MLQRLASQKEVLASQCRKSQLARVQESIGAAWATEDKAA